MYFPIRAITLDLDDTLWPFAPIGARVEQVLHDWLLQHCPRTAQRFPIEAMRALREAVYTERPDLSHDFSQLRRVMPSRNEVSVKSCDSNQAFFSDFVDALVKALSAGRKESHSRGRRILPATLGNAISAS